MTLLEYNHVSSLLVFGLGMSQINTINKYRNIGKSYASAVSVRMKR